MAEKKQRMAGEALKDQHFAARERKSNDPEQAAERASRVGDGFDVSGYSDKEISMALQGDTFDKNDYARLTGKSIDDKPENDPKPENPPEGGSPGVDPPVTTNPVPDDKPNRPPINIYPGPGGPGGSQTQVVTQDNDQTSNVTGDNNTVTQNQDNSVSQNGYSSGASARASGLKDKYVLNLTNRRGV